MGASVSARRTRSRMYALKARLISAALLLGLAFSLNAAPLSNDERKCEESFQSSYKQRDAIRVQGAIEACVSLARSGNALGEYYVGRMYQLGVGFEKNLKTAAGWYTRATKKRQPDATAMLGRMYERGEGVNKDPATAAKLMLLAAKMGHPQAQYDVGTQYYTGEGVQRNYLEAYKWFTLAVRSNEQQGNRSLVKLATRKRKNAASRLSSAQRDAAKAWLRSQR